MNSKTIIRRTLPLIIALFVIILVALAGTIFSGEKKVPTISNPDGTFLTVGDITIPNSRVYNDLKKQQGLATLIDLFDKQLMESQKNADDVSYFNAVTEEAIDDEIEKAIFPNGRSDDDDENDETISDWERSMFLTYGHRTEAERRAYYRLTLAKTQYVRDLIVKEYLDSIANNVDGDDDTYTDDTIQESAITNYYNSNYKKSYWAILVKYNTLQEAKNALGQLGIVIKTNENSKDSWFWGATDVELTEEEIKQTFIDLYNTTNIHKAPGYPNADPADDVVLGADQYSIVEGNIVFNTTRDDNEDSPKNLFYYTTAELNALYASMEAYVGGLDAYLATNATLLKTFSVNPKTWSSANSYYFVFKIQYEDPQALTDEVEDGVTLRDEIIEKIIDGRVTSTVIRTRMTALRQTLGVTIYDTGLEATYISSYDSTHKTTKKASDTIVAVLGEVEYTADALFTELTKRYGVLASVDYYQYENMLYSEHNTIYDYKGPNEAGTVLDQDEWDDILEQIVYTKRALASGSYAEYGYAANYGWTNFLKDFFSANYGISIQNEDDLKIFYLYQKVVSKYAEAVAETTQDMWDDVYVPAMTDTYNKYVSATGMHLLIHKLDDAGNTVDPADWTAYEKACAEELYNKVITMLKAQRPSKYKELLQTTIVTAYDNAPRFVSGLTQDAASQPVWSPATEWVDLDITDYEYAKYKSAGLVIKFESLTTTAGVMVEPFENAVRAIWNESETDNEFGEKVVIYDDSYEDYLITSFGYHVYVNLTTTNRPTALVSNVATVAPLPTLEDVLKYEEDDADEDLTVLIKKSITTYYTPIRTELKGSSFFQLRINQDMLASIDQVTFTDTTLNSNDELTTILDYYIETYFANLKYVKASE